MRSSDGQKRLAVLIVARMEAPWPRCKLIRMIRETELCPLNRHWSLEAAHQATQRAEWYMSIRDLGLYSHPCLGMHLGVQTVGLARRREPF